MPRFASDPEIERLMKKLSELEAAVRQLDPYSMNERLSMHGFYREIDKIEKRLEALRKAPKTASGLRSQVIRLAHAKPELRPHLLPLLRQASVDFSPPENVGNKRGAEGWVAMMRSIILEAPPGSPERQKLIADAVGQLGYAAFLFRKRSALKSFFDAEAAKIKNLKDTYEG